MRTYISILLLLVICDFAHAQGFSEKYDFGSGASFHNLLLKEDTVIIVGTTKNMENTQWGLLFVKMDTLGNILDQRLHLDTMDGQYAFEKGYPLIATPDGGYLAAGVLFNRESYFIMKLSVDGDLEYMREYPEPADILTNFPQRLALASDGYLIFSQLQQQNGKLDIQMTKTDFQGEIQWTETFGLFGVTEGISSVYKLDDDTYVIGASRVTDVYPHPDGVPCSRSWFFAVDSLGSLKWEHFGEPCESGRSYGLRPTGDGGWIYATSELQVYNQSNFGYASKLVKLDSGFGVVWEKKVGESYGGFNVMIDFEQAPDGGWLGVGTWVQPMPLYGWSNGHIYVPGCTMKFSAEGDSVWARFDTLAVPEVTSSYYFGGVAVLPSGSSIAVGSFRENQSGIAKSWAWAIKLDANGCLGGECAYTRVEERERGKGGLVAFPNPANDHVTFQWNTQDKNVAHLIVADLTGRTVWETDMGNLNNRAVWNTAGNEEGIYLYQLKGAGGTLHSGKIIIRK